MQIVQRTLRLVADFAFTLLVGTFIVFVSLYLAPGSPLATLSGGRALSPEAQAAIEARYGLDQPFVVQYLSWLGRALQGDFGDSIIYQAPVSSIITQGTKVSVPLVILALIIVAVFGISLGTLAGVRGAKTDVMVNSAFSAGLAIPAFVAAPILIAVFAVGLQWFPIIYPPGDASLGRLFLPAVAVSISLIAFVGRVTRANVRTAQHTESSDFARLRGLSPALILRRYIFRPSMLGLTTIVGLTIASLIGALIVVEVAFQLPGLGFFLISAVNGRDYALVQGITLMFFIFFLLLNTVIDLLYPLLDPRVAHRKAAIA